MAVKEITYEQLLAMGIPQRTLHAIIHYLFHQQKQAIAGAVLPPRHPTVMVQYYKNFCLRDRLCTYCTSANGLSLLKTKFAKKPKNPV